MEDVLNVYQRPYDPKRPVVCIDETNKQLVEEKRIPCIPGQVEKVDSEYIRHGIVDVFMAVEPLAGKRKTEVTQTRTAKDFAYFVKDLLDNEYAEAEKVVLVTDNLNTHTIASFYKTFEPAEALRLAERIEWHYTPKHGSWLDMAEIELSVMCRQALAKPFSNIEDFRSAITAWTAKRNSEVRKINWQFTTLDARIKLRKLYPVL
jgi:transposase